MTHRYRELRIRVHSRHPLVWVSGVRQALRRAGAGRDEIHRFSAAALGSADPERTRQICASWAEIDVVEGDRTAGG